MDVVHEVEKKRPAYKLISDASYSVSRLLEDYYDIAESDDLSKEDKEKVQDLAAELKNHTTILQSMMGAAGSKSKRNDNKPDDKQKDDENSTEKDEFLAGLEEE